MEENKVSLKELINKFKNIHDDTEKRSFIGAQVEFNEYVSYLAKVSAARDLVASTCYDEDTGEFKNNTPERYIAYVVSAIILYTNIDMDAEDGTNYGNYDLLQINGFMDALFDVIGLKTNGDVEVYKVVWKMCYEDMKEYYSSIENLLRKSATRIGLIANTGLYKLASVLEGTDLTELVKRLDGLKDFADSLTFDENSSILKNDVVKGKC